MVGRVVSHYRILEPLGAGGMGEVYRARDEHLEREVALKVLPKAALEDESARRRFRQEALALSRLSHPHIATVFEFDSAGGADFLVMELVPGQPLTEHIAAGPVAEAEIAALGAQIAAALQAAHERGVVHRDLKPANIQVTPAGQVKVMDFGVARLLQTEDPAAQAVTRTQAGDLVGTLPYMAPEQLLGRPADERTDIYALGVVLYEMAAGQRPFRASLSTALVYEIINDPPPRPRERRPALAAWLEEAILRCLEKSPEKRFASAGELAELLGSAGASGAAAAGTPRGAAAGAAPAGAHPAIHSLAVLPLRNLSGDPEQEFFADGMTEALIADLAQIGALRVISRTSAMQYKGVSRPIPEIARALGVDAVVEGSVMRSGGRVRITAQLIEGASDRTLWARSYERDVVDTLALQGEVGQAIAREIHVHITPQEAVRLARERAVHPDAHVAYLKGRFLWNQWTAENLQAGVRFFEQAIALDPGYALAYAGLADCYAVLGNTNALPPAEAYGKSAAAARAGLALDETVAELHASLGYSLWFHAWDWAAAEQEFRRAVELNPGYATAQRWYAQFLSNLGRHEQAIAKARVAQQLDPLSLIIYTAVGDVLFYARLYDQAIEQYRRCLEMNPRFLPGRTDLARAYELSGRYEEAEAEFLTAAQIAGSPPETFSGLANVYARWGRREEARRILDQLIERARRQFVSPYAIASIYASLDEPDAAFEWLERAWQERDGALVLLKVHPRLDRLRGDPRYADLLRRMRLGG